MMIGHQHNTIPQQRRHFSRFHASLRQQQQQEQEVTPEEEATAENVQMAAAEDAVAQAAEKDAEFLAQLSDEQLNNTEQMTQEQIVNLLFQSRDKIAEKDAAIRDWQVKALDALAEMENIRRISKRDIEQIQSSQKLAFFKDFVSIVDKLEETTTLLPESMVEQQEQLIQKDPDYKHPILLLQGLQMTNTELYKVLNKHKIRATPERLGVEFDPRLHNVVDTVESATYSDGTPLPANHVVSVQKRGYLLGDQVLRQAQVVIVKPPPPPPPESQKEDKSPESEADTKSKQSEK